MERFTQNALAQPGAARWISGRDAVRQGLKGVVPPQAPRRVPIVDRSLRARCAGDRRRYGGLALLGLRDDMWSVRSGASPWAGEA